MEDCAAHPVNVMDALTIKLTNTKSKLRDARLQSGIPLPLKINNKQCFKLPLIGPLRLSVEAIVVAIVENQTARKNIANVIRLVLLAAFFVIAVNARMMRNLEQII